MAISTYLRGNANEIIYFNDPQAEVVVNDCPGNAGYHEKMVLILIHSISTVRTYRDWKHSDTREQRRENTDERNLWALLASTRTDSTA